MKRRDFVRRMPGVPTGVALGTGVLPLLGCAGAPYVSPSPRPGGVAIPAASLRGAAGVFVPVPGLERPLWITRAAEGEAVAVVAACTHRGCQPDPVGDRLVCPCHGSVFTLVGEVVEGPAEAPLRRLVVEERDGEIFVRTQGVAR